MEIKSFKYLRVWIVVEHISSEEVYHRVKNMRLSLRCAQILYILHIFRRGVEQSGSSSGS